MHMLQANEDLALRRSVEAGYNSAQVNWPSRGVILFVLAGAELAGSDQGMCNMQYSVSIAHAQLEHAI